ncbi:MAG: aldehyde dehydrogenase family protein [Firmicutes bacterium]|nr:aldehyde dehydrogenase family protein [Bacillota bacterium]
MDKKEILQKLGIEEINLGASTGSDWFAAAGGRVMTSYSPIDGEPIAQVNCAGVDDYERVVRTAEEAFAVWRKVPAPKRGEVVRQICLRLREQKEYLGALISLEMGKIYQEGLGEVQEMIDISDLAVGMSRQLYGLTMPSERFEHRIMEQWHPLGPIGIITAYNFPMAVWSWNAMIGAVCGDVMIWKPSSQTVLCAVAVQKLVQQVCREQGVPEGVFNVLIGSGREVGDPIANDNRIKMVSFTGSSEVGRHVGEQVAKRFGRTILELGGNNAVIVTPHADMDMALRSIVFGAVGTTGQRCTSTRRVIVHESVYDKLKDSLAKAYSKLKIGDPFAEGVLVGPMIDAKAADDFAATVEKAVQQGGELICGGHKLDMKGGCYVEPAIVGVYGDMPLVKDENFCPVLFLIPYSGGIEEALAIHNQVPQGLSSAIFSNDFREVETFLSAAGSDCGIANVNLGTSGAEIGSAFGGEKETGGGRESGSDAWKGYMRRQTNGINFSKELPLAQGIEFTF